MSSMIARDDPDGSDRPSRLNLLLIDDHAVVRAGLRLLIEQQPDMRVCGEAGSIRDALAVDCAPDVILLDLVLDDTMRGPDTVAAVAAAFPGVPALALSMIDSLPIVDAVLAAGAKGYVLKDAAATEVVRAIRAVSVGEEYLQPSLGAALIRWKDRLVATASPGAAALTEREQEILRLVALGHTNAEIARTLALAIRTVETHRSHIVHKTGARTRAQLVRLAQQAQLIT